MKPKYAINKAEGEHLSETNRRHLAREWNNRIEALDAKLSFHRFAKMMRIPASTWRREYYRGGGIRPSRHLKSWGHWSFGRYDPVLEERNADDFRSTFPLHCFALAPKAPPDENLDKSPLPCLKRPRPLPPLFACLRLPSAATTGSHPLIPTAGMDEKHCAFQ